MTHLLKIAQAQKTPDWVEVLQKIISGLRTFHTYLPYAYPVAGALAMRGLVGPQVLMPTRWQMLRGAQPILRYPYWPLIVGGLAGTLAVPSVRKYLAEFFKKEPSKDKSSEGKSSAHAKESSIKEGRAKDKDEAPRQPLIAYIYPAFHIGTRAGLGALIARGLMSPQVVPIRAGIGRAPTLVFRYRKLPLILGAVAGALSSPYAYSAIYSALAKLNELLTKLRRR
ncbi:MAG: hypothetical protein QW228_01150 [Candidatus Aenigmatarchaeota archaeon]